MKLCVFDIEVLPNCFICCCKVAGQPIVTFEISARKFQLKELVDFFRAQQCVFVGYNCIHYDTPVINMLINNYGTLKGHNYATVTNEIYRLSNTIITGDAFAWKKYKYANFFKQIDLMTMMASKALRVGLKSLQVTMHYRNVKEARIKWSEDVAENIIDDIIHYCHNDVGSTTELLKLLIPDLKLRMDIEREFHVKCLSKDGVGIGVDIFTKYVCDELEEESGKDLMKYRDNYSVIPVRDFLVDEIEFKTPALKKVHEFYQNLVLDHKGEATISGGTVLVNNLIHSYGIGGLHSVNKPGIFVSDDEWIIIDSDVASMYPTMSDKWNFAPKGIKEAFLHVLRLLKQLRLEAKRNKDSIKDKTYKLALNSILGHLRNEYGPYYAPEANVGICVNGQLFLLMLIEECEANGIQCISSNTDGITLRMRRTDLDKYYEICNRWQELSRMELEHVEYEKIVISAVNDYVAFKKGYSEIKDQIQFPNPDEMIEYNYSYVKCNDAGYLLDKYVKQKGMFVTHSRLGKGLDSLIIPKALINYFGKGIPIEETIRGSKTIWDFVKFQKIGKQYEVVCANEIQQHINRFYVSKNGAYLYKQKEVQKYNKKTGKTENIKTLENVVKGFGITIFNEYIDKPMADYDINYGYYISQTRDIIESIQTSQYSLF